jgi:hypothetical protein
MGEEGEEWRGGRRVERRAKSGEEGEEWRGGRRVERRAKSGEEVDGDESREVVYIDYEGH